VLIKREGEPLQREKMLEALMSLGLTYLQARSYLALTHFGQAEAKDIAKASEIARQDIYRIMPTLEKLGLAEKMVAAPILYKATPLKDGLAMLLHAKVTEQTLLRKRVKFLLNNDQEGSFDAIIPEESTQFIITSEKKLLVKKFQTSLLGARTCDLVFPAFAWNFVMFNLSEEIGVAVTKGARIRIVTQESTISPLIYRKVEILRKHSCFQIRFTRSTIDFGIAIFDGGEVNVCVSDNMLEVPSLCTNNPQFLKIAQIAFDCEWNNAVDYSNMQLKLLSSSLT